MQYLHPARNQDIGKNEQCLQKARTWSFIARGLVIPITCTHTAAPAKPREAVKMTKAHKINAAALGLQAYVQSLRRTYSDPRSSGRRAG
jgi:hypothetical protein